jgi:hypothetical protein
MLFHIVSILHKDTRGCQGHLRNVNKQQRVVDKQRFQVDIEKWKCYEYALTRKKKESRHLIDLFKLMVDPIGNSVSGKFKKENILTTFRHQQQDEDINRSGAG